MLRRLLLIAGIGLTATLGSLRGERVPSACDPNMLIDLGPAAVGPGVACFDPDNLPTLDVMEAINEQMAIDPSGLRYSLGGRWSGGQGDPRALTWSFVPDGLSIPAGISGDTTAPSNLFARMDALFANNGGRATWIAQFQASFDRWAELTGTSYTRITFGGNEWDDGAGWGAGGSSSRGDIRISMRNITVGGVLAFNQFPSNGDMVMDSSPFWDNGSPGFVFLRNVIMHEHGHGLGIQHSCPQTSSKIMEPAINTNFDGPQHDDIRAGQRHYGDPFEPNSTAGDATDLGTLAVGSSTTIGPLTSSPVNFGSLLSVDDNSDVDFFRFTLDDAAQLNITLTPIGTSYDASSQSCGTSNGCCSGNVINTSETQNLAVQLRESNGSTIIVTASGEPAGVPEQIDTVVGLAGDYYVRVYPSSGVNNMQLYHLTVSVGEADCNDNLILDPCDLDCGLPGCNVPGCGGSFDCNENFIADECETDCNLDGLADECALVGNPDSMLVCPMEAVSFSVDASPAVTSFQWKQNGVPLIDDGRIIGAQTAMLSISSVEPQDLGDYTCELSDGCVLAESSAGTLDVVVNGAIINQPPPMVASCSGTTAVFSLTTGGGSPAPSFQWYKDGAPLVESAKYEGVDTNTLRVTAVDLADEAIYTCDVSSGCGSITSEDSAFEIADPVFTLQPEDVCVQTGGTAVFTTTATSPTGGIGYQWRRNGTPLSDGGAISGALTDTLTISGVGAANLGLYSVLTYSLPSPICLLESEVGVLTLDVCNTCPTPGDFDTDGDSDLVDVQNFFACFGADVTAVVECECANIENSNTVVDLADWDAMTALLGGPL